MPGFKTKNLTERKLMLTFRTRYFKDEITLEIWWNLVWCFYFFVFLQLIIKVFYCWMNMFKSVIWLKGSHLETVPRSIEEITCITKRKSQECQNRELGQPKMCETKIQLQSKSLWELMIFHCLCYYSGFIQTPAVEIHSQNIPWPSQNPRDDKESIRLTKKLQQALFHYVLENVCMV